MLLGLMMAADSNSRPQVQTQTVEKLIEKTPQSCLDVIEMDQTTIRLTAGAIETGRYTELNTYLRDNTDKRTAHGIDCKSKA